MFAWLTIITLIQIRRNVTVTGKMITTKTYLAMQYAQGKKNTRRKAPPLQSPTARPVNFRALNPGKGSGPFLAMQKRVLTPFFHNNAAPIDGTAMPSYRTVRNWYLPKSNAILSESFTKVKREVLFLPAEKSISP